MKKRIMSCFMALALCLTLLPTAALADDSNHTAGDHTGFTKLWMKADGTLMKGDDTWNVSTDGYGSYLPLNTGKYYLETALVLKNAYIAIRGVDVTLCLNDKTISCGDNTDPNYMIGVYYNNSQDQIAGHLTLTDCQNNDGKISGGSQKAVLVGGGSTLDMYGGTITSSSGYGVNVNSSGNDNKKTTFNMNGGTITGSSGYGVLLDGGTAAEFTMSGGTISNNKGRGVLVQGGTFTMKDGATITDNTVTGNNGGGVYVNSNSTFNMEGGTISNNKATGGSNSYGGGVFVTSGSKFNMSGTAQITGNTASTDGGGVFVDSGTTFTVSGTPTITGNNNIRNGSNVTNNVHLFNNTITIGTGGLTESESTKPQIGVTVDSKYAPTDGNPVAITSTNATETYKDYFVSDSDKCLTQFNSTDSTVELAAVPKTELTSRNTKITITNTGGFVYSGTEITPTVTVTYDGNTPLNLGTDYTVSYANNTNAGTATVIVTGKDNYTGEVTQRWTIDKRIISVSNVTLKDKVYNGKVEDDPNKVTGVIFENLPTGAAQPDYTIKSVTYTDANVSAKEQNIDVEVKKNASGSARFAPQ